MKIVRFKTTIVNLPLAEPITTAIHDMRTVGCVLLSLETDQGLIGESYVFSLNALRIKAFEEMIIGLEHHVINKDPHYVEQITQDIWREINPTGYKGLTISALSAIDTACWDLVGKAANTPLHKLFGACRDSVKTYASGGLWLSQSIDSLCEQAQQFVDDGFRAMKVRIGSPNTSDDVARVAAVRATIGDNIELLADANQALKPKQAIQLGKQLEEYNLAWIEEPVHANDLEGHAKVTRALSTPIASGETEYTRFGMKSMIEKQACDILMPDLQRIGGLSEMIKVAHLASAHHMDISTHIFTEQSLCIAGSASNCISVEHMPWFSELFNEELELANGDLLIPQRAGIGFTFNQKVVERHRI